MSDNDQRGSPEPSATVSALAPGGIRAVAAVGHPDAINLLFGEPDFVTPEHIARAGIEAIERHQTRYAPGRGIVPLREAVARRMTARTGTAISVDDVTITAGGVQALLGALYAVAEVGDCVLVPDPGWPNYVGQCALLGLTPIPYPLRIENAFQPDLDELRTLIATLPAGTRAAAIILNSPNNPTGAVWAPAHVTGIVELAQRHGMWVISDEVYDEIVFEGPHLPAATVAPERTLTISSFSKTYAMTGWRVGYLTAPSAIGALVGKVLELEASCVSTPSQHAALAALLGPQECIGTMREAYASRRDLAVARLKGHGLYTATPSGAFYALADASSVTTDTGALARRLATSPDGVIFAPGRAFGRGGEGLLRLSLAARPSDIVEGIERLARFCNSEKIVDC